MTTRIVLADDHMLVRAGLCKLLESIPGFEVVGQADNGEQVLEMVAQLAPDLVLLDIAMPQRNGLDACAELLRLHPRLRVIMLSMHHEQQYVRRALQNGAAGYLLKDSAPAELQTALETVLRDQPYLSPGASRSILGDMMGRLRTNERAADEPTLTPRQREVLKLVARGLSTKEVARELDLSIKTVDSHRSNLMNQLNIHDVAGLVRYAIRSGLISSAV